MPITNGRSRILQLGYSPATLDNQQVEPPLLLLKGAAIALAFFGGWLLARAVPGWQIDYQNELTITGLQGEAENRIDPVLGFFQGAWGAFILLVVSQVLGVYGWEEQLRHDLNPLGETYGFELLLTFSFWILIAAALAGYIFSRIGDKGPVGPLE